MGKILALDIGTKRVGYAVSSEDQLVVFPRDTLMKKSDQKLVEEIGEIIVREKISTVVIGVPLDKENQPTEEAKKIKIVGGKIERVIKIPVFYLDEFSTTDEALAKIPFKRDRRKKGFRDAIAAQIILQRYLDQR